MAGIQGRGLCRGRSTIGFFGWPEEEETGSRSSGEGSKFLRLSKTLKIFIIFKLSIY